MLDTSNKKERFGPFRPFGQRSLTFCCWCTIDLSKGLVVTIRIRNVVNFWKYFSWEMGRPANSTITFTTLFYTKWIRLWNCDKEADRRNNTHIGEIVIPMANLVLHPTKTLLPHSAAATGNPGPPTFMRCLSSKERNTLWSLRRIASSLWYLNSTAA